MVLAYGMGLNLAQSLVGLSLHLYLCSIFVPAHLVGRTHFGSMFCGWVAVLNHPLVSCLTTGSSHFRIHFIHWFQLALLP